MIRELIDLHEKDCAHNQVCIALGLGKTEEGHGSSDEEVEILGMRKVRSPSPIIVKKRQRKELLP